MMNPAAIPYKKLILTIKLIEIWIAPPLRKELGCKLGMRVKMRKNLY
jgi:hypothetical protein